MDIAREYNKLHRETDPDDGLAYIRYSDAAAFASKLHNELFKFGSLCRHMPESDLFWDTVDGYDSWDCQSLYISNMIPASKESGKEAKLKAKIDGKLEDVVIVRTNLVFKGMYEFAIESYTLAMKSERSRMFVGIPDPMLGKYAISPAEEKKLNGDYSGLVDLVEFEKSIPNSVLGMFDSIPKYADSKTEVHFVKASDLLDMAKSLQNVCKQAKFDRVNPKESSLFWYEMDLCGNWSEQGVCNNHLLPIGDDAYPTFWAREDEDIIEAVIYRTYVTFKSAVDYAVSSFYVNEVGVFSLSDMLGPILEREFNDYLCISSDENMGCSDPDIDELSDLGKL